jgi:hypothetical protein
MSLGRFRLGGLLINAEGAEVSQGVLAFKIGHARLAVFEPLVSQLR